MGTLYNQQPRKYHQVGYGDVVHKIENIKEISKECKVSVETVLKVAEILEIKRRNDLFVDNGDIWDEQIAGIGDCINNLSSYIAIISDNIKSE